MSAPDPGDHAGSVRDRLRALPQRTRAALALVVVVLAAVPVAVTLARPDTFTSTFVVAQEDASQVSNLALDERLVRTIRGIETQRRIVALRDLPGWSLSQPRPEPTTGPGPRPGTVRVTIPADTAAESLDLARVAVSVIAAQARRTSRARAVALERLREIEVALDRRGVSRAQRSGLREEAAFIRNGLPSLIALRVSDPPTAVPLDGLERRMHRVFSSDVPRPDPVWAGAVGLLLGLAVCSLWLTLIGRRS